MPFLERQLSGKKEMKTAQQGQSLVEILIVLAITAVVLTGLAIAVINSLHNSQFAQNQAKATKYAQDAIEKIQAVRDRDGSVELWGADTFTGGGSCTGSSCPFSELWNRVLSDPSDHLCSITPPDTDKAVSGTLGCYFYLANPLSVSLQEIHDSSASWDNTGLDPGFSRQIFIYDKYDSGYPPEQPNNEKDVVVRVRWTDAVGNHESNLQTVLTNHQQ
ncbi:prepilin-type N-terminal cleavage/methylation domain-containing protein [Patescibacteria group bacterium]|nr:prepilin-type N-terminal cleavage/methylation domain-containing protein [Patescibacteria group bacterium]MCL5409938.1 prepilin-type N-terminal cleavage/methylation domain-containing protein [Patescibacteria group bacterium]